MTLFVIGKIGRRKVVNSTHRPIDRFPREDGNGGPVMPATSLHAGSGGCGSWCCWSRLRTRRAEVEKSAEDVVVHAADFGRLAGP